MPNNFVKIGVVADFVPNAAPTDVSVTVQRVVPGAVARMVSRFSDAPNNSPVFISVSSICTHKGCPVLTGDGVWGSAAQPIYDAGNRVITCPCHGSEFRVDTGQVVRGPATSSLATFEVQISGQDVLVAANPNASLMRELSLLVPEKPFPAVGHIYRVDFGKFVVELNFEAMNKMTYTGIRPDGSRGRPETVTTTVVPLRPGVFMVTWQEADRTTVVHVEDYDNSLIYTNIVNPDNSFEQYQGIVTLVG
jgi:Rieske Fe-S protein